MSKQCVVTGAGGFIGRKLAHALKERGNYVCGIDVHHAEGSCDQFDEADITEPLAATLFKGVDTVFHLAGKVHALSEVKQDDQQYYRINTEGTRNVLEAARVAHVRRVVFFSTIKAMSRDEGGWRTAEDGRRRTEGGAGGRLDGPTRPVGVVARAFSEEDVVEPDTAYGKSKFEAEKLVLHGGYVPEPVVLRLCMVYGPGAKGNMQKMLQAVAKHRFPALPEVNNKRSMVHVDDAVRAAMLAAKRTEAVGQTFIVSDGCSYSTRKMYALMCQALGRRPPGWSVPVPFLRALGLVGDAIGKLRGKRFVFDSDALEKLIGSAWFSSKKIETMLDFKPEWNLEKALPEMVAEIRDA